MCKPEKSFCVIVMLQVLNQKKYSFINSSTQTFPEAHHQCLLMEYACTTHGANVQFSALIIPNMHHPICTMSSTSSSALQTQQRRTPLLFIFLTVIHIVRTRLTGMYEKKMENSFTWKPWAERAIYHIYNEWLRRRSLGVSHFFSIQNRGCGVVAFSFLSSCHF